jgi:uncharacterized membrane protein
MRDRHDPLLERSLRSGFIAKFSEIEASTLSFQENTRDGLIAILKFMQAIDQRVMPASAADNINTIVQLEEQALKERRMADRISDAIANFVGSIPFVAIHVAWFGIWVALNAGGWRFDPYPFALLCMLVSLEGVLLSTFVLIKQNRMSQRADHRSHLDLQINLLSEKEVTKVLQLQRLMCRQLGITEADADKEIVELSGITAVDNLARELDHKMPTDT